MLQTIKEEFWDSQGDVSVTEAVGFVLAGQVDAAAINDSLTDYLQLLALLCRYNSPEQQLQLLKVSQGVLKQSAQTMRDFADFQSQLLHILQQLLQVCFALQMLHMIQASAIMSRYALLHTPASQKRSALISQCCDWQVHIGTISYDLTSTNCSNLSCMQIDPAYHIDGLEVLKGSKLLRTSARAVKTHSKVADVFQNAVALLNMLLTEYRGSTCFDALVEEVLDSNLALEVEIAVRDMQVLATVA